MAVAVLVVVLHVLLSRLKKSSKVDDGGARIFLSEGPYPNISMLLSYCDGCHVPLYYLLYVFFILTHVIARKMRALFLR
jgi:hypothetical protein